MCAHRCIPVVQKPAAYRGVSSSSSLAMTAKQQQQQQHSDHGTSSCDGQDKPLIGCYFKFALKESEGELKSILSDNNNNSILDADTPSAKGYPHLLQLTPSACTMLFKSAHSGRMLSESESLQLKYKQEYRALLPILSSALTSVMRAHDSLQSTDDDDDDASYSGSSGAGIGTEEAPSEESSAGHTSMKAMTNQAAAAASVGPASFSPFFTPSVSATSVRDFIHRVIKYTFVSPSVLLIACVYLDRLLIAYPSLRLHLTNVFRLYLTAVRVASKVYDTRTLNNKDFATVGGVSNTALNDLETCFVRHMRFDLFVAPEELYEYAGPIFGQPASPWPQAHLSPAHAQLYERQGLEKQQQQQQCAFPSVNNSGGYPVEGLSRNSITSQRSSLRRLSCASSASPTITAVSPKQNRRVLQSSMSTITNHPISCLISASRPALCPSISYSERSPSVAECRSFVTDENYNNNNNNNNSARFHRPPAALPPPPITHTKPKECVTNNNNNNNCGGEGRDTSPSSPTAAVKRLCSGQYRKSANTIRSRRSSSILSISQTGESNNTNNNDTSTPNYANVRRRPVVDVPGGLCDTPQLGVVPIHISSGSQAYTGNPPAPSSKHGSSNSLDSDSNMIVTTNNMNITNHKKMVLKARPLPKAYPHGPHEGRCHSHPGGGNGSQALAWAALQAGVEGKQLHTNTNTTSNNKNDILFSTGIHNSNNNNNINNNNNSGILLKSRNPLKWSRLTYVPQPPHTQNRIV